MMKEVNTFRPGKFTAHRNETPYMVDSSSSTSSAYEWDTCFTEGSEVDFRPWVLISTDDDTRRITVD